MSLQALKVSELKEIATEYGVDIAEAKNKADILAVLAEEGVTDELLNNLATVQKEELPQALEPVPKYPSSDTKNIELLERI